MESIPLQQTLLILMSTGGNVKQESPITRSLGLYYEENFKCSSVQQLKIQIMIKDIFNSIFIVLKF